VRRGEKNPKSPPPRVWEKEAGVRRRFSKLAPMPSQRTLTGLEAAPGDAMTGARQKLACTYGKFLLRCAGGTFLLGWWWFYSRSNSAALLVTSTDRELNTRGPAGSSPQHLMSGGSLHDTGRRARRGRATGRLPWALRTALRQGAGAGPRLRLPQGADGLPRAQEHRADRPAGGARRRLGPAEVRRGRPLGIRRRHGRGPGVVRRGAGPLGGRLARRRGRGDRRVGLHQEGAALRRGGTSAQ